MSKVGDDVDNDDCDYDDDHHHFKHYQLVS